MPASVLRSYPSVSGESGFGTIALTALRLRNRNFGESYETEASVF
jgi:hypothetical protein